ncbi:hypothetical protein ASC97_31865 [Rhizobium sp. Root1203]|uniref:transposase n=1 Tax=Rhizobium sp. Root1203 TaxID=1736427 RepID=UPI00070905E5|nr:transposase [Rhizobium sp. Root1203]KQV13842.1 hypothetical protein ASC97_31865 [Rhizobium sp. Root1203]
MLLLPEAVDDYVGTENPARFIEAFVDGLDLQAAGFSRVIPKATGRPGYDPADLLKLYIDGYLNRVLLRHLKPDFKTIADFRRDNRTAFRQVFREFVLLCRQLDLFGRELLAVDGTRIKAVNNKDRNFTRGALSKFIREADEKLDGYMTRLDEGDADEDRSGNGGSGRGDGKLAEKIAAIKGKRDRHKALLDELDRAGGNQISMTDPDSRAMARMTKVGVGYNVQLAVDVKHKLIAEQEVEAVVDRMAARLAARPEVLDRRRESVEHPFGTIKQWMNQGAFLMRRLENVRGEFSLTALAYNIRRVITLIGVAGLIAAVRA